MSGSVRVGHCARHLAGTRTSERDRQELRATVEWSKAPLVCLLCVQPTAQASSADVRCHLLDIEVAPTPLRPRSRKFLLVRRHSPGLGLRQRL
ncbi:hypothetical protein Strop_0595 [Salinispora tropica CNB-440]|uniref:Uncharacterized protein n=1 Tax=Salinispora tropica (strain ATCC BAA-916 / DSM 44818 / JCM 13857 / NBRC 105044 / CNB-440) TaxID=369723 RepID=A4X2H5_SALTO|nr:hypothetical protein Strop_0595 [Salinispora tropica CNB-440]